MSCQYRSIGCGNQHQTFGPSYSAPGVFTHGREFERRMKDAGIDHLRAKHLIDENKLGFTTYRIQDSRDSVQYLRELARVHRKHAPQ